MRIWHFISGDLWAGAEVMACTLLKGLRRYPEFAPAALLLNEGRVAEELRGAGVPVVICAEKDHSFPALVQGVRRTLAVAPADVIHAHRYKENILAYLASRPGRSVPLVTTQHGLPEPRDKRWPGTCVDQLNHWLLARRFHQVVAVASPIRDDYFRRLKIPAERSRVICNGIELPALPAPPANARPVLGAVGRLVPVKDFSLLVAVARELRAAGEPALFRLAGDGPLRAVLEQEIDNNGLREEFRLEGEVADIAPFYRQLDIYLSTSLHEGLPMSALEAMAHGLPVVAPDVGGFRDLIEHGKEGFLVASRDPGAYAAFCRQLLANPALRQRLGQAARAKVAGRFSAEAMAAAYARLYRQACGAAPRREDDDA